MDTKRTDSAGGHWFNHLASLRVVAACLLGAGGAIASGAWFAATTVGTIGSRIDAMHQELAAQRDASSAVQADLGRRIGELEARRQSDDMQARQMAAAISSLQATNDAILRSVADLKTLVLNRLFAPTQGGGR